jgi:hypothetical protein
MSYPRPTNFFVGKETLGARGREVPRAPAKKIEAYQRETVSRKVIRHSQRAVFSREKLLARVSQTFS